MPFTLPRRQIGIAAAGAAALALWVVGAVFVLLPIGDGLLRLSYDSLYLFARQQADPGVVIVALNEATDRTLGRRQGEPFSRAHHARLVERLESAGSERICYDILFDLPSSEPAADEAFRQAIKSHGRVVLGGVLDRSERGNMTQARIFPPAEFLRSVAEAWGTLNVEPIDLDGTVRRFATRQELGTPLAIAAAEAGNPGLTSGSHDSVPWLQYTAPPGQISIFEFSECLDPSILPDEVFRGKTVFVGGNYSSDEIGHLDVYRTPYSRFGAPDMAGVEWHANAFLNARDQLWLRQGSATGSLLWCIPLALMCLPIMLNRRPWLNTAIVLAVGLVVSILAVFLIWNSHVLFPWLIPLVVQLPVALGLQTSHTLLARKIRYFKPIDLTQVEDLVVFISFASQDLREAEDFRQALDHNQRKAWMCTEHIPAGSDWPVHLSTAIENCRVLVFLISQHSVRSTFCESELNLAMTLKKPILPVILDHTPIPNRLRILMGMRQIIDGCDKPSHDVIQQLLAGIEEALEPAEEGKSD